MALEAWGHRRIEADEPFDKVLSDVLGPPGAPAAYLLVAVDLMLSHWPKSCEAAVPFLACPELLCLDRRRQLLDNFKYPDIFGLNALQKEPPGVTSLDKLKKYPSRRQMFEHLIGCYGAFGPDELRQTLSGLLRQAVARLGPPSDQSDLGTLLLWPSMRSIFSILAIGPKCQSCGMTERRRRLAITSRQKGKSAIWNACRRVPANGRRQPVCRLL